MTAPAPSPAEQALIDRFGIFEPEERVIEEVARAMWEREGTRFRVTPWDEISESAREQYRGDAAAAVAAYRAAQDGGAEEAVRRWIEEAASALQAATVISERMHRTGVVEGLNLGNHDRLVREAQSLRAVLAAVDGGGQR